MTITRKPLGTPGSLDTCRCGTKAKKVPRDGKLRYRHKCPHGKWCDHGSRLHGRHANRNAACRGCIAEARARRLAADVPSTGKGSKAMKTSRPATRWVSARRPGLVLEDDDVELCERCCGTGKVPRHGDDTPCPDCLGHGHVHGWDSNGYALPARLLQQCQECGHDRAYHVRGTCVMCDRANLCSGFRETA